MGRKPTKPYVGARTYFVIGLVITLASCSGLDVKERAASANSPKAREVARDSLPKQSASSARTPDQGLRRVDQGLKGDSVTACDFGDYALRDLAAKSISLSYQDVDAAMNVLSAMGYTVLVSGGAGNQAPQPSQRYTCDQLPVVMLNAESDDSKLSIAAPEVINSGFEDEGGAFAGDGSYQAAYQGGSVGGVAQGGLNTINRSHSADVDRVVAFYHPQQPQVLSRLQEHIRYVVDSPAPQVYIEGWVLEISEEDSRELGIRYAEGVDQSKSIGLGATDENTDTVDFLSDNRLDIDGNPLLITAEGVLKRIRAFVENEKAKILSRPSLLTLSNRQSVIQVVDVIQFPLLQTTFQGLGNVTSGVQFGSLKIGITLNLRPRVSGDRQWVSLEIDATVDAEDEENTGQAFSVPPDGGEAVLVSEKPGFNSRRVHTFARIPDRTPIIVGGLVSTEDSTLKRRIPWIGEIPYLGALFGFTDADVTQREIMIVLTPYVLAEDTASVRSNTPKESETFDDTNMKLFDNRYRLRSEDVFDLRQITEDPRFVRHEQAAKRAIHTDPNLLLDPTFSAFVHGQLPGGEALVDRTFFDLARKLGLDLELDPDRVWVSMITDAKIVPSNLEDMLDAVGADQVLMLSSGSAQTPVSIYAEVVDASYEVPADALRITDKADMLRLINAVAAQELIALNGGQRSLKVRQLNAGQFVALPSFENDESFSVNAQTLQVYRNSVDYARVLDAQLEAAYQAVSRQRFESAPSQRQQLPPQDDLAVPLSPQPALIQDAVPPNSQPTPEGGAQALP